ncbi:Hypothetical predicted protein [Mytilus galloprovincialis]|uniref:Uncharacterized protein n=1 Tax=Mytilus galloprovincialis TaxID=29158 RepID=A0A8B6CNE0_MYTGA|nr:Hypothetical predicted protein [Mytilus galloprovincialis]
MVSLLQVGARLVCQIEIHSLDEKKSNKRWLQRHQLKEIEKLLKVPVRAKIEERDKNDIRSQNILTGSTVRLGYVFKKKSLHHTLLLGEEESGEEDFYSTAHTVFREKVVVFVTSLESQDTKSVTKLAKVLHDCSQSQTSSVSISNYFTKQSSTSQNGSHGNIKQNGSTENGVSSNEGKRKAIKNLVGRTNKAISKVKKEKRIAKILQNFKKIEGEEPDCSSNTVSSSTESHLTKNLVQDSKPFITGLCSIEQETVSTNCSSSVTSVSSQQETSNSSSESGQNDMCINYRGTKYGSNYPPYIDSCQSEIDYIDIEIDCHSTIVPKFSPMTPPKIQNGCDSGSDSTCIETDYISTTKSKSSQQSNYNILKDVTTTSDTVDYGFPDDMPDIKKAITSETVEDEFPDDMPDIVSDCSLDLTEPPEDMPDIINEHSSFEFCLEDDNLGANYDPTENDEVDVISDCLDMAENLLQVPMVTDNKMEEDVIYTNTDIYDNEGDCQITDLCHSDTDERLEENDIQTGDIVVNDLVFDYKNSQQTTNVETYHQGTDLTEKEISQQTTNTMETNVLSDSNSSDSELPDCDFIAYKSRRRTSIFQRAIDICQVIKTNKDKRHVTTSPDNEVTKNEKNKRKRNKRVLPSFSPSTSEDELNPPKVAKTDGDVNGFNFDDNMNEVSDEEVECFILSVDESGNDMDNKIKNSGTVCNLTEDQLKYLVLKNKMYLKSIFQGNTESWRHLDYKKGGRSRKLLNHQVHLGLFTEEQQDIVMETLMSIFCKKHHKFMEYVMKVLLPEMLIKIHMAVNSVSHRESEVMMMEALSKPGGVYI